MIKIRLTERVVEELLRERHSEQYGVTVVRAEILGSPYKDGLSVDVAVLFRGESGRVFVDQFVMSSHYLFKLGGITSEQERDIQMGLFNNNSQPYDPVEPESFSAPLRKIEV